MSVSGTSRPNQLVLRPQTPVETLTVILKAKALERVPNIEAHHTYLWLRCEVTLEGGTSLAYEFRTKGLVYYGG